MTTQDEELTRIQTKEKIDQIIQAKLHGAKPTTIKTGDGNSEADYIRYTPASITDGKEGINSGKKERIIKITDKKQDPMLPPSFKIKKAPRGPPEQSSVPVLHEQSKVKLTSEDQKKWYIPPTISNWKNPNGFTISIDKRLASIGKDETAQDMNIDKFADFNGALENARKQGAKDIKARAVLKAKDDKRKLLENQEKLAKVSSSLKKEKKKSRWADDDDEDEEEEEDQEKLKAASKRERARMERKRKAEKELKMVNMSTESKLQMMARESGKELSTRVKVGLSNGNEKGKSKMEATYDSRLFLNAAGANARHSEDQVYSAPLFEAQTAINDIYRVRNDDKFTGGGDGDSETGLEKSTGGPIAFERDPDSSKRVRRD